MTRSHCLAYLLSLVSACAISSAPLAQPHIVQTDCDTLGFDPVRIRIAFDVMNPDPTPAPICVMILRPVEAEAESQDSCTIAGCEAPSGDWICGFNSSIGTWNLFSGDPVGCIDANESHGSFAVIVSDPGPCCFTASFFSMVPEPFYTTLVCFCDGPVQATSHTWGRIKSLYR